MKYRKILLAYNGSAEGKRALVECAELANFLHAETHLLAVASLKQQGFAAAGHLAVGEPVEEICRLAKELSVDLIVVGHNQKTSFAARWWKGSVGASILDYAPCSLLVALSRS
jgi:nucleotide-binding universal stress UspA family protein